MRMSIYIDVAYPLKYTGECEKTRALLWLAEYLLSLYWQGYLHIVRNYRIATL